jgi:hypothetical protein
MGRDTHVSSVDCAYVDTAGGRRAIDGLHARKLVSARRADTRPGRPSLGGRTKGLISLDDVDDADAGQLYELCTETVRYPECCDDALCGGWLQFRTATARAAKVPTCTSSVAPKARFISGPYGPEPFNTEILPSESCRPLVSATP